MEVIGKRVDSKKTLAFGGQLSAIGKAFANCRKPTAESQLANDFTKFS
jgi:hypothetical protein